MLGGLVACSIKGTRVSPEGAEPLEEILRGLGPDWMQLGLALQTEVQPRSWRSPSYQQE